MTGTAREVRGELGAVYDLAVARIPTHRPSQRRVFPARIFASAQDKWRAVSASIMQMHQAGRPVLVGTRSVADTEHAVRLLAEAGIPHQVLNAKQDRDEAAIIAKVAGGCKRVTIATNMAGRGTDIKLAPEVAQYGGAHVILTECHDARRIDRQLAGRGARQGDAGSFEALTSLEDDLFESYRGTWLMRVAQRLLTMRGAIGTHAVGVLQQFAQRRVEWRHSTQRKALLRAQQKLDEWLAFSGPAE